jgi:penicillin amidase
MEDMAKLQGDNYNLKAAESLPLFLGLLDTTTFTADEKNAYAILKSWNYFNEVASEGASYYEAWWDQLMPLAWDEMVNGKVALSRPTTYNTIKLIKERPDLSFFDIQGTPEKETAKEVVQKSFSEGVKDITTWKADHNNQTTVGWADFKDSYVGHLLRLDPVSFHIKHGGNHDIVNAHSRTHGPSWRMIVSLEKTGVKSWAVYPGGQSGNPGSYYYNNMLDRWTADKHFRMMFIHTPEEAGSQALYSYSTQSHHEMKFHDTIHSS